MNNQLIWPEIPADIPHGDMPGDKICIDGGHIQKAKTLFPELVKVLEARNTAKTVIAVCGGSGVGKSEIASVLAYCLNNAGIGTYVLSGDNYPRRIPRENDAERLRIYRHGGLRGLVAQGLVTPEISAELRKLWEEEQDANAASAENADWLKVYQKAARRALTGYLGTPNETDFDELSDILSRFHQGAEKIVLKRMGRENAELWYDQVNFKGIQVLIVEWTHGNSDFLQGVDIPILLNSTPAETLAHRRARNRDGKTDSAFTMTVLEIEQQKLEAQAHKACFILSKQGELLSYREYRQLMANE